MALAVAGLVSGASYAQTNLTVYGIMDMSYTYSKMGDAKFSGMQSGGWDGRVLVSRKRRWETASRRFSPWNLAQTKITVQVWPTRVWRLSGCLENLAKSPWVSAKCPEQPVSVRQQLERKLSVSDRPDVG